MSWFDLLKNIQIASQRTSSKDYVNPDDEDEECREWWLQLQDMLNALASKLHPQNGSNSIDFEFVEEKSEEELCILRDDITKRSNWSFRYTSSLGSYMHTLFLFTQFKNGGTMQFGAFEFGEDYKCNIDISIRDELGKFIFYETILWKEMNEYPDDYRDELDAIERHLNIGGLLLSFMYKGHLIAIGEG